MRLPMMASGLSVGGFPATCRGRARAPDLFGCSNAEIAPCNAFGVAPGEPGWPPGSPNCRMNIGVALGLLQSRTSMACDCFQSAGGGPGVKVAALLPGAYVMPVLHSHHCLCVERRLRIAETGEADGCAGSLTS